MFYKYRGAANVSRSMQSVFSGLNKNPRISDSEFSDMTNMTGDNYPLLSPRAPRVVAQKQMDGKNLNGILGDVGFCAVWGSDFYYMGKKVDGITLDDGEKKLVAMGADILIFPDTVYYNTVSGEIGSLDTGETYQGSVVISDFEFEDGRKLGDTIKVKYTYKGNSSKVESERKMLLRFGAVENRRILKAYDGHPVPARINNGQIEFLYKATINKIDLSGEAYCEYYAPYTWLKLPIKNIYLSEAPQLGSNNLWANGEYVSLVGSKLTLKTAGYVGSVLTDFGYDRNYPSAPIYTANYRWTGRNFPVFDYVCVHGNRLWGCRYGDQINGATDCNEIYCSTLGDFKDWTTGTGADNAFSFSVGEYGAFTGCTSVRGHLLFFKDNVVYRVTGDRPSNISCDIISENGLQDGCEKTPMVIDNILYYKSRNGVYAYDGSVPYKVSDALGIGYFENAVAGKHFNKYYISMEQSGVRKLYVYDTRTRLWHAEDDIDARFFTEYDGAFYAAADNNIVCLSGDVADIFTATEEETAVQWRAETGDIGLDSPYQKYYRRVLIRMDIDMGASVSVDLCCNSGEWYTAADFTAHKKQSFVMPIITERCDHMRMRIRGSGVAKIYSVSFETETVGDKFSGG